MASRIDEKLLLLLGFGMIVNLAAVYSLMAHTDISVCHDTAQLSLSSFPLLSTKQLDLAKYTIAFHLVVF